MHPIGRQFPSGRRNTQGWVGARTLVGRCIFINSGYARLISFEISFITKETSRAEPEYMNIHPPPPISVLAPTLSLRNFGHQVSGVEVCIIFMVKYLIRVCFAGKSLSRVFYRFRIAKKISSEAFQPCMSIWKPEPNEYIANILESFNRR